MNDNYVSTRNQILLWFGAAVSIAEIMAGALIAPLGLQNGLFAIFFGHVIGAVILFLSGYIGAQSRLSAAESSRISFGEKGSYAFSILNILQLVGWTAVMITGGAQAFNGITASLWGISNQPLWSIIIGLLIILWIVVGIKNLSKLNTFVIAILFALSLLLGYLVFKDLSGGNVFQGDLSFGAAIELNVAMSLSWMPLISDYTRELKKPKTGTFFSVLSYFFGSVLMFAIGLGAALYAVSADITSILLASGLGIAGLAIVVLSTVTTTFLDVYSVGVSADNLSGKFKIKPIAIIATIVGVLISLLLPIDQYENFLYLIGSVFAPLFAILFVDYYIFKNKTIKNLPNFNIKNLVLWIIGIFIYRFLMKYNTFIGITLPVMLLIALLCFAVNQASKLFNSSK